MRYLAWATDLHLNFICAEGEKYSSFLEDARSGEIDALLVGGDTAESTSLIEWLERLLADLGVPLFLVLGNHDYYHGGIKETRRSLIEFVKGTDFVEWIGSPSDRITDLNDRVTLVGVDGWGDARLGDPEGSDVVLSDFVLIRELRDAYMAQDLFAALRALGDEEAARLSRKLAAVPAGCRHVLILTHVSPFRESCWHEGRISGDNWLPFFTCQAVGEVLREAALQNPYVEYLVLCGHAHGDGKAAILPNLSVLSGSARYGAPMIQGVFDLEIPFQFEPHLGSMRDHS